jgi:hypothetical protein
MPVVFVCSVPGIVLIKERLGTRDLHAGLLVDFV